MISDRQPKYEFSTLQDDFLINPAQTYMALRSLPPIFWSSVESGWVLHRYSDIAHVLADRSFAVVELAEVVRSLSEVAKKDTADLQAVLNEILFLRNPPGHSEARQFLVAVLNNRPLSYHQPLIAHIARSLLSYAPRDIPWDVATTYADLIPPLFMGQLLGLDRDIVLQLVETVSEVTKAFDRGRSLRFYERVNQTVTKALGPIADVIAARRKKPRDDGISRMIALSDKQFFVTDRELANRALFLIIGGVETTSALIGNVIASVIDHPAAWLALKSDPDRSIAAVEEGLRYDGPVQQITRIATIDCEIAGQPVVSGDRLVLLVGAAHRDPEIFSNPDMFDIYRPAQQHLAFGAGMHFCIGAALARLEAQIALKELIAFAPFSADICQREWLRHRTLRRLASLTILLPSRSL